MTHRYRSGPRNLITDVPGLKVGNAGDAALKSGTTVLVGEGPLVAAVDVRGGGPGTRETDLLEPHRLVEGVDALFLSGGSAFGLDAGSGVAASLARQGKGFAVGPARVPIVPGAVLFDLLNGGDKAWDASPYAGFGAAALEAADVAFEIGSAGCGLGATTADLKGGLGSASLLLPGGIVVGALVGANPVGSTVLGREGHFWAAPFEIGEEFGGRGACPVRPEYEDTTLTKGDARVAGANTTIAIVATNARLDKGGAKALAVAAHDGMARAISPSHTLADGDLVFAVSTGEVAIADPLAGRMALAHAAASCLARAIARAVHAATPAPGDLVPTWKERFGG